MIVVDNSQYLIEQIEKKAASEKEKLEQEHKQRVEMLREQFREEIDAELRKLREDHESELEKIRKQKESNFELQSRRKISQKKDEIFDRLIERMKKTSKEKLVKVMTKRLGKMKSFEVPKGVKIAKAKDTLKDFRVIGHSKEGNFEVSFEDLLDDNIVKVREIAEKELIKNA